MLKCTNKGALTCPPCCWHLGCVKRRQQYAFHLAHARLTHLNLRVTFPSFMAKEPFLSPRAVSGTTAKGQSLDSEFVYMKC